MQVAKKDKNCVIEYKRNTFLTKHFCGMGQDGSKPFGKSNLLKLQAITIFLVVIFVIGGFNLFSLAYTPLKPYEIKNLVDSDSRVVLNLHGKWKRYFNGEYSFVNIPKSEFSQETYSYEKTIKIEKNLIENYTFQLYLLGCDDQAEIYINGQFLGRYFGGMTSFSTIIPSKMLIGEMNTVKVVVSPAESLVKKIKENTIYSKKTYTGLIREVFLVATPKIWVNDIKYNVKLSNNYSSGDIDLHYKISTSEIGKLLSTLLKDTLATNTMMKAEVSTKAVLYDGSNNVVAESESQNLVVQSQRTYEVKSNLTISNPLLWSNENPNLYRLKVLISKNGVNIDNLSISLGFKELKVIQVDGKSLFSFNGKDFNIKAVSYVEDFSKSFQTISPWRIEEDIAMIKTLGVNVIRFKYNAPHPYLIHLCNKYGLLALIELPIYDLPPSILNTDEVKVRMSNIVERNLLNLDAAPCLMAYGIYSGIDEQNADIRAYESKITGLIRKNSSHFIYKIISSNSPEVNVDNYDFIGIKDNVNKGDIKAVKKIIINIQNQIKNKPTFISYGISIQPDNKNGYSDPLSPEYQAYYLRNMFYLIKERDLVGGCFNTFNDYRIENPLLVSNNKNLFISYSGLVDINRNPRLAYKMLQTLYNQEKEPLLNVGSFSVSTPVIYVVVGGFAFLLILFFIKTSHRFKEYLIRASIRPYNFYADIRDQRIISTLQTFILGIVIALSIGVFSSSLLYHYRDSEAAQSILMLIIPFQSLQAFLYPIIWEPIGLMFFFTFLYFLLMFLIALALRIAAIFVKGRIFFIDTITIAIWTGLPFLIILPFAVILVKLIVNFPNSIWLLTSMSVFLTIWVFSRLLKACAVVFDKPSFLVNTVGVTVVFISIGIPMIVYHYTYQIFSYFVYIFDAFMS